MPDMALGHDEAVITDTRTLLSGYATVDDNMLTNHIVIADVAVARLTFPSEILRIGAYYRALVHLIVLTHTGTGHDACIGHYFTVVTNLHICVNKREGMNLDILA